VLARGPAYTMRLALTYALTDGAASIGTDHLLAGLAVWQYAAATARLVFPDAQAVRDLKRFYDLLTAAGPAGLTRSDISTAFGRNRRAGELADLAAALLARGVATEQVERAPSGPGRPAVRYRATGRDLDPMAELLRTHT